MTRYFPHMALTIAMIVWSTSFLALKIALSVYSPPEVMAGRMLAASLVCLPALKTVLSVLHNKTTRKALFLCVLCDPCLYFLCETFALRYTSSAQAGMVIALLPLAVAAGAWILLGERLRARVWVGFALAIGGVIALTLGSVATESSPAPLLGNFLEFLAVLCATGYTLMVRKLTTNNGARLGPIALTAASSYAGALFFLPLCLLPLSLEPVNLGAEIPPWLPVACIIYLGTIVTFVGYGLYNYGICRLSAGRAAAYTNLIPVLTVLMGVMWMGDVLTPAQYIAAIIVIVGIIMSQGGNLPDKKA